MKRRARTNGRADKPVQPTSDTSFQRTAPCARTMLFASFFKTLVGKQITVELKNDLAIVGTLHSVDQVRPFSVPSACGASRR